MQYRVSLVAVSGREQPVLLRVERGGLLLLTGAEKVCNVVCERCCLHTPRSTVANLPPAWGRMPPTSKPPPPPPQSSALHACAAMVAQEIQRLPYHNVVKWLPSSLRSKDPGGPDCLDVQVETSSGKKVKPSGKDWGGRKGGGGGTAWPRTCACWLVGWVSGCHATGGQQPRLCSVPGQLSAGMPPPPAGRRSPWRYPVGLAHAVRLASHRGGGHAGHPRDRAGHHAAADAWPVAPGRGRRRRSVPLG